MRLGSQRQDVAPSVRVRASDRLLDLAHRHAVLFQEARVQKHLILLDSPPVSGHVDDARNLFEERVQHPILNGLELIRRVARAFEDVANNLPGRAPGRKTRLDVRGKVYRGDAVDDFLPRPPIIGAVAELALDIAQTRDGRAPEGFEARHPIEGDFQRPGDEPLHLLGARPGIQGDHLDEGRRGVGIGLNVQIRGRVNARANQADDPEDDDEPIVEAPGYDGMDHWADPNPA